MSEVLSARSFVYWWGFLTTFIFLKDWARDAAKFIRESGFFDPQRVPFNLLPSLDAMIDGIAIGAIEAVGFDPTATFFTIGGRNVPNLVVLLFVGFIVMIIAARMLMRAVASKALYDDFLALIVLYIVLRVESNVAEAVRLPIALLLKKTGFYVAGLTLVLFILLLSGQGFRNRRTFWRGLLEGVIVYLFVFPSQTALAIAGLLEALSEFGRNLQTNVYFGVVWGVLGVVLSIRHLYANGFLPRRRERGQES
ncbi:MAG: hypothetical protein ACE5NP_02835 [Anaerolineae bacterium]